MSTPPSFVGRREEMTRLRDVADQAVEAGAQMVLLSGDAGIGKSTLTSEFLAQLHDDGWGTHVGHCIEYADRPLPFGPVVALLRSVLLDNLVHIDLIVGHHREDLAALLPELGDDGLAASLSGDVDRLLDAIGAALVNAAERRPLALLVEDIHWGDGATRDLLSSLVLTLGQSRVLIIVTERSGAVHRAHPLTTWLAEQRRFPNVHTFELEGLSEEEVAAQANAVLGARPEPRYVGELFQRTKGNPYFCAELLGAYSHGSDELPDTLVDFLTGRLERLPADQLEVLRAMAVAGGKVSHPVLTSMAPDIDVGAAVRALFDASIVTLDGSEYTFGHDLLREALVSRLLPFELQDLHRRAAEAIAEHLPGQASLRDAVSLAIHWNGAGDADRSVESAVLAAYAAAGVAAADTAADMVIQALGNWDRSRDPGSLEDRIRLLADAADWFSGCHRAEEAVSLIDEALSGWAVPARAGLKALLLAAQTPCLHAIGRPDAAREALRKASGLVADEVSTEAARVHQSSSQQALQDGQIQPAAASAERVIAITESVGPLVLYVEALLTKSLAVGVLEDVDRAVELCRQARAIAEENHFVAQVARGYRTEMLIVNFREGRTERSLQALVEGVRFADSNCGPTARQEMRAHLALGYVEAGQLAKAEPVLEKLRANEYDDLKRVVTLHTTALLWLGKGALDKAAAVLESSAELAAQFKSAQETGVQERCLAELERREGRLDEALGHINRALKLQRNNDNITYTRESILEKTRICRALRDADAAMVDEEADAYELVEAFEAPGPANAALKALMQLELDVMDSRATPAEATAVADSVRACGFLYEACQAQLLAVELLITSGGSRAEIRSLLLAVRADAFEHGINWLVERCEAFARIAKVHLEQIDGAELAPAQPTPAALPHGLTAREVEVMALLAEGLTNKAIGEALYVSPRTISTHISNLLAKLGVSNRGAAAAAYHRLGLSETIDLRSGVLTD